MDSLISRNTLFVCFIYLIKYFAFYFLFFLFTKVHIHTHKHVFLLLVLEGEGKAHMSSDNISDENSARLLSSAALRGLARLSASRGLSPESLLSQLLAQYHARFLVDMPDHLLLYIFDYLDYPTLSSVVTAVCRDWWSIVKDSGAHPTTAAYFTHQRQIHGVHLLHPTKGIYYYPRALKAHAQVSADGAGLDVLTGSHRVNAANRLSRLFLQTEVRTHGAADSCVWQQLSAPGVPAGSPLRSLTLAAVATAHRQVYLFGGEAPPALVLSGAYSYNPATKVVTPLPPLPKTSLPCGNMDIGDDYEALLRLERSGKEAGGARAAAVATAVGGRVFVFGGYDSSRVVLDTYEVFNTVSGQWEEEGGRAMPGPVCGASAVSCGFYVFLVGGFSGVADESGRPLMPADGPTEDARDTLWVLDTRTQEWTVSAARLPGPRSFGAAVLLPVHAGGDEEGGDEDLSLCYMGGCSHARCAQFEIFHIRVTAILEEVKGRSDRDDNSESDNVASGGDEARGRLRWETLERGVLGGPLLSAAVLGPAVDPTLVLQGFFPKASLAFCKWRTALARQEDWWDHWQVVPTGETVLRRNPVGGVVSLEMPREHWIARKINGRIIVGIE